MAGRVFERVTPARRRPLRLHRLHRKSAEGVPSAPAFPENGFTPRCYRRIPAQAGQVIGQESRKRPPDPWMKVQGEPTSWPPGRWTRWAGAAPASLAAMPHRSPRTPAAREQPTRQADSARVRSDGARSPSGRLAVPRPQGPPGTRQGFLEADLHPEGGMGPRGWPTAIRQPPVHRWRLDPPPTPAPVRPKRGVSLTLLAGHAHLGDKGGAAATQETADGHRCPGCSPRGRRTGRTPSSKMAPGAPARLAGERASSDLGWREGVDGRGSTGIFGRDS